MNAKRPAMCWRRAGRPVIGFVGGMMARARTIARGMCIAVLWSAMRSTILRASGRRASGWYALTRTFIFGTNSGRLEAPTSIYLEGVTCDYFILMIHCRRNR